MTLHAASEYNETAYRLRVAGAKRRRNRRSSGRPRVGHEIAISRHVNRLFSFNIIMLSWRGPKIINRRSRWLAMFLEIVAAIYNRREVTLNLACFARSAENHMPYAPYGRR